MFRRPIMLTMLVLMLAGAGMAGVFARGSQVRADATPGAHDVSGIILGGVDASVIPGYRLVMAETTFLPGAYVTQHMHPTAIVVCVQSGALGFAIQHGTAFVTRGGSEDVETLAVNTDIVLEPRNCVSFDHFAAHTVHTAWNASDGETVLLEARLFKTDEPFTVFVDAEGTPEAMTSPNNLRLVRGIAPLP